MNDFVRKDKQNEFALEARPEGDNQVDLALGLSERRLASEGRGRHPRGHASQGAAHQVQGHPDLQL